jgi:tetraacyldisaccharide 4'-kinase
MKLLRILLFPIVPIYFLVTWLRNKAYDKGIFSSKSYEFPLICVGNLSAGGTGKSPMVGYLIHLLKQDYSVATLSRGYGRATKGFVLAETKTSYKDVGDESFQYFENFGSDITVAVCEDRQNGIKQLRDLKSKPEVIVLDDAFQHRKVKAGLNILLTTYSNLFTDDFVLPTGNLREPKSGYKRAQIIVVTKCPVDLSLDEKNIITSKINPLKKQRVFFSYISYAKTVKSKFSEKKLSDLKPFILVTGIANATPLVNYLKSEALEFNHLEFKDHYNFNENDIAKMNTSAEVILTTEKDYMRLKEYEVLKDKLFYLPISVFIDAEDEFNTEIKTYVSANL